MTFEISIGFHIGKIKKKHYVLLKANFEAPSFLLKFAHEQTAVFDYCKCASCISHQMISRLGL